MSIVAMNSFGLLMKCPMMFDAKTPCFLSSSIFSLLAVMNAISIPLEKADANKERKMTKGQYESIKQGG
jgi:hypothetical protein